MLQFKANSKNVALPGTTLGDVSIKWKLYFSCIAPILYKIY